jgi:hypothetical protein
MRGNTTVINTHRFAWIQLAMSQQVPECPISRLETWQDHLCYKLSENPYDYQQFWGQKESSLSDMIV